MTTATATRRDTATVEPKKLAVHLERVTNDPVITGMLALIGGRCDRWATTPPLTADGIVASITGCGAARICDPRPSPPDGILADARTIRDAFASLGYETVGGPEGEP